MQAESLLIVLLILAALALAWWSNMVAREIALGAGRRACRERGAQLLDWAVAHDRYALRHDGRGHLRLRRTYIFEFSGPGLERGCGWVTLLGRYVHEVKFEQPNGGIEFETIDG